MLVTYALSNSSYTEANEMFRWITLKGRKETMVSQEHLINQHDWQDLHVNNSEVL